jgi:putative endonuclease
LPNIVYILYSQKLDRYYIGNTDLAVEERLKQHNNQFNSGSFTTRGIPWVIFLTLPCHTRLQAIKVELHIKKMKSKKIYPELGSI